jgi:hypothetical protein
VIGANRFDALDLGYQHIVLNNPAQIAGLFTYHAWEFLEMWIQQTLKIMPAIYFQKEFVDEGVRR